MHHIIDHIEMDIETYNRAKNLQGLIDLLSGEMQKVRKMK